MNPFKQVRWNRSVGIAIGCIGGLLFLGCGRTSDPGATGQEAPSGGKAVETAKPVPLEMEFKEIGRQLRLTKNPISGMGQVTELRAMLAKPGVPPEKRSAFLFHLSKELLRVGELDDALECVNEALAQVRDNPTLEKTVPFLTAQRGLIYFRQSEVQNCIQNHNRDCCLFPLRDGGIHQKPMPARFALADFRACLERAPDDLTMRWLLNVTSMALGEYPRSVPERWLIPPSAFESEYDIGRFTDVAPALGVATFSLAGGAIMEDFDNDSLLDIVASDVSYDGGASYYRNLGNGRFEDLSKSSGLSVQGGALNCVAGDYDNDGLLDLLLLRGAWLRHDGRIRSSLLHNNGDGTFKDVTHAAGLALPAYPTQTAAWGDFDNDGWLDLYVGHESLIASPPPNPNFPNQLFRNNRDGTFTDIAAKAGVTNDRFCKGVTAGDFDNDGWLDIYVSNWDHNRLYRNNGNGTFTDVAVRAGVTEPFDSFATWFFDYDNDGWLDLYVGAYDATVTDIAADTLKMPFKSPIPRLYHNNKDGTFKDVTVAMGLNHAWLPMGAGFGDLDNDGWLDFYLATGGPPLEFIMPNVMLRNDAGKRFQNVTTSGGFGHLQKGHGVSFADLDNDGDQDIYLEVGGVVPSDLFNNALFLNPGHRGHFLYISLKGTKSNRRGLGARIQVTVDTPAGSRSIHRAVGSISSFGSVPSRQEIGLGDATSITSVEIWWPASGVRQTIQGVSLDSYISVTESTPGFKTEVLKRVPIQAEGKAAQASVSATPK